MASRVKEQMADPLRPFWFVVKTPWNKLSSPSLNTSWISSKKNGKSPGIEQFSLALRYVTWKISTIYFKALAINGATGAKAPAHFGKEAQILTQ